MRNFLISLMIISAPNFVNADIQKENEKFELKLTSDIKQFVSNELNDMQVQHIEWYRQNKKKDPDAWYYYQCGYIQALMKVKDHIDTLAHTGS